jgi:hypothetical protein
MGQERHPEASNGSARHPPPPDRTWGWCRRVTPALQRLLERRRLWVDGADHVAVLAANSHDVILVYWRGALVIGRRMAPTSVGRDVARLGAPESV